jgi:MraZ protein
MNEKLSENLSLTNPKHREFSRFMLSGAQEVELDKQGRVRIPDFLKDYAGLEKKLV